MARKRKNPMAVALGRRGGNARMTRMTSDQRKAVAKKAAEARWEMERERKQKENGR